MINFSTSKYSQKAKEFLRKKPSDFKFITLLDGSVRSSKTVNVILKFVDYSFYMANKGTILIAGYSKNTVFNNFLDELFNFIENVIGGKYNYNASSGLLAIDFGNGLIGNYLVVGDGNSDSYKAIRGKTLAGAFVDELTLAHSLFIKEMFNRLSVEGAKVFCTTNPDDICHWVYKDYILPYITKDHPRHNDILDIFEYWHFTLRDNANLSSEYIERISKTYQGAFYQRMIEGHWVVADGLVYPSFKQNHHTLDWDTMHDKIINNDFMEYFADIDWGFTHKQTAHIIGVTRDYQYYVLDEYCMTGQQPEHVIEWIQNKMSEFGIFIDRIFPDTARLDSCDKVSQSGFIVYDKPARVEPSIDTLRQVIYEDRFYICDRCKNTINEFLTYRYPNEDEKLKHSFEPDKPLKQNDDCMDAIRYGIAGYEKQFNMSRFR